MDPLIEHPPLLIILDLVLLKPRVYLHLLFNRGHPPKDGRPDQTIQSNPLPKSNDTLPGIWTDWAHLVLITVLAESASRSVNQSHASTLDAFQSIVTVGSVMAELLAQHLVTTLTALAALSLRGWWKGARVEEALDGRQKHFK